MIQRNIEDEQSAFNRLKECAPPGRSVCIHISMWKMEHIKHDTVHYAAYIDRENDEPGANSGLCNTPAEAVDKVLEKIKEKGGEQTC